MATDAFKSVIESGHRFGSKKEKEKDKKKMFKIRTVSFLTDFFDFKTSECTTLMYSVDQQ